MDIDWVTEYISLKKGVSAVPLRWWYGFASNFASFQSLLKFLDVLKSLELPLLIFSESGLVLFIQEVVADQI